jgi:hypothetical protein
LDDVSSIGRDLLQFSFPTADAYCCGVSQMGKVGAFVGRTAPSFNKLPHEMIQGTPKIMDSVANNERDSVWDGLDLSDVKRRVLNCGYRVRLGPKSVRLILDENLDNCIKVTDELFGPFNFEANATDSVGSHANLSLALWPRFDHMTAI